MTPLTDTATQVRMPPIEAAPAFCDLVWRREGDAVFVAARTPLYDAAASCARSGMEAAGFVLDGPHVELDLAGCADIERLAKRLAVWTAAAERELAFTRKRDAARRPVAREAVELLQDGLDSMIASAASAAWAFGGRLDLAERFASEPNLTRKQFDWACGILGSATAAVESVDARLATPAGAEALERAYDEGVRNDLLLACRELSGLDTDRCREANGQGWSATTSGPGHRLASMDSLSPTLAAHALALVFPHRRQLSPALRDRLFEPAPEPSPAP
ncbi:hypothetical protein FV226_27060 [Methylobacterium sp. WL12]|uniref:hypothetical protein n=1 Tax=Methylobacterium sp. WL12 TaxID=2603890 RepID=UPI0011CA37E4|nr:hypothetical protein [Methylobacterium sp. WL12]TXM63963.1 hypothetical protein FV226_27060 [Methylobacterium sp. WL12]